MTFKITYTNPLRAPRTVDETHFARSSVFAPVLKREVGESITKRYRSAGYAEIKRVA